MKPKFNPFPPAAAAVCIALATATSASAASGTWIKTTTGGWWGTTAYWAGGIVADGDTANADFSTLDITTDMSLQLNTARTLNSLTFGDTATATAGSWAVGNNGTAANILTLAGATPTITVNALGTNKTATISAVIGGTAGMTKAGAGTLVLSGANTYSGGTSLSNTSDTVEITVANATALGTGTVLVNGGQQYASSIQVNDNLTVANALTLKRGASGSGRATLGLGSGTTWGGNITVDNTSTSGIAAVIAGGAGAATASIVSGNIGYSTLGTGNSLVLRGGKYGKVTGSVSMSTGTVQLLDGSKWEFSNAANTWGTLDINNASAIVTVDAADTLPSSGVVSSTVGGTLQLNNQAGTTAYSQTIAGLGGNVKVGLATGSATLTLNTTADQSASGVISGAISLVKSGTAKQTLTGANTYTGTTTVNGGTLALGTTGAIGTGDLTVSSATLDLRKGTATRVPTVSNLTLSDATLEIGLNANPDGLIATGTTTISGTNTLKLHGTLPAGTYSLISTAAPLTGTFSLDTTDVTTSGFTGSYTAAIEGNNYVLTVGGTETPFTAYWRGDVSAVWNDASLAPNSNWATDSTGATDTAQLPGVISDVFFSAATATNTDTTLGADLSINSLTFESGTATVGGANTLTIVATSGNGLDVLSGATATLNTAATVLTATATAAVQTGGTLTVNGGGLGGTALLVDGTLNLNMNVTHSALSGAATGIISRTSAGTSTLTVSGSSNCAFAGSLANGAGTLVLAKAGASTLTLSGANTYSGGTTVSGGIIQVNSDTALGTGTVSIPSGDSKIYLGTGVAIANNITCSTSGSTGYQGFITATGGTLATVTGTVTLNSNPSTGGHFASSGTGSVLRLAGPINSTGGIIPNARVGVVEVGGGGNYTNFNVGEGTLRLAATNGLNPAAVLSMATSAPATFDLAGFNQTLAGVNQNNTKAATIGNSSTTADSVLTTTGTGTFAGVIKNTVGSGTRTVALTVNGGTLTLGGINTYTGNTTVNAGSLVLADNAQLKFAIGATSGTNNSLTGVAATLDGDFNIDTTLADASALTSGTWTLESVTSLTGAYSGTFQVFSGVTAWTATGDKWSKTVGAKTYTFDETTGVLTLTSGGYDSWATSKGLTGADAAFDADPDLDGLDNGLEFVLGGEPNPANPGSNSAGLLPTVAQTGGNMTFTFKRKDLSESGVALIFQWSADLTFPSPANDIPVGAVDSVTDTINVDVTEDSPDADTDTIVITVPAAKAAVGKLFGRLKAVKNP